MKEQETGKKKKKKKEINKEFEEVKTGANRHQGRAHRSRVRQQQHKA